MIIPYKANIATHQHPISNYIIMIALVSIFVFQKLSSPESLIPFVLTGWSLPGLIGHMWLHSGYLHIFGNLIFLWVFGNAICSKLGKVVYPYVYICLGFVAGMEHLIFARQPIVGASGAIFGIMGMYLVLYPYNSIKCFLFPMFFFRFNIAGVWIITWWFILNLLGALTGYTAISKVAYIVHVGGFLSGAILVITLLKLKLVQKTDDKEWIRELWQ